MALFRRHVDVAEVLLRERLHGTVTLHLRDRGIQLLLQRGIALADTERDAAAENLVVTHRLADERETLAVRTRQKTCLSRRREHERRVEAARDPIPIDLILVLIRHDRDPPGVP